MTQSNSRTPARRRFLTSMGIAATGAAVAAGTRAASNMPATGSGFVPTRHPEDSWMEELGGSHRAFLDSSSGSGGVSAMNFASNILSAHADAYAGASEADYALIVCFRHDSSPFGFNDAMWEKYGELFSARTGIRHVDTDQPLTFNPLSLERSPYGNRSNTVTNMSARGVHFAVCNLSTRGMAGMLARSTGASSDAVYQELVNNSIPNSHFVPAGVVAATRSQEYGYSFLFAG
ncbi:MAG: hypothetical protein R3F41_20390 [Gammaproteobacteria bacterium]|nr:hypothetical protein [Pseudomonadales bacterium]MCP5346507.1 hypothetical protein [Pseudomonadales bacterium]